MPRTLAIAAIASAALVALPAAAAEPFRMASMDEVQRMLGEKDVAVYDANPAEVYAKNHLPGARFVGRDFGAKTLPADKATRLVFYCSNPR
jgi:3-mercaptopyruvate sulfurtransferase SseA